MLPLAFPNLKSILCLGAHADDIEIGCGAALLRLLAEQPGTRVHWVVFGAAGERVNEARRSAEEFLSAAGEREIVIHNFRDSYFPAQWTEIKDAFQEMSRNLKPDVVFTHRLDDRHQDHRLLAELTWNGFRNHNVLEYEIPKYEGDLGQPSLFVPVSEAACQQKIEILHRCFPTQATKPWFTPDTFWALLRLRGLECHSPTKFAEAFYTRKLVW